jgi:shikimate kinase
VVWLQASAEVQLQRLARDRTRPLLQRADREEVLRQLAVERAPLYAEVADLAFDTDGLAAIDAACALGTLLRERWQCDDALPVALAAASKRAANDQGSA